MANIRPVLHAIKTDTQGHFVGALLRLTDVISPNRDTQNTHHRGHTTTIIQDLSGIHHNTLLLCPSTDDDQCHMERTPM